MFKKLFSSKKEVVSSSKVEKLNKNELQNVLGGGSGATAPAAGTSPIPDPSDRKSGQISAADFK